MILQSYILKVPPPLEKSVSLPRPKSSVSPPPAEDGASPGILFTFLFYNFTYFWFLVFFNSVSRLMFWPSLSYSFLCSLHFCILKYILQRRRDQLKQKQNLHLWLLERELLFLQVVSSQLFTETLINCFLVCFFCLNPYPSQLLQVSYVSVQLLVQLYIALVVIVPYCLQRRNHLHQYLSLQLFLLTSCYYYLCLGDICLFFCFCLVSIFHLSTF